MYRAVTRGIQVSVTPQFLEDRSSVAQSRFFWAYSVEILNLGTATVQLRTRHWRITDQFGRVQEVRGAGVVGEQPILRPGESFSYTSGVPLGTPNGIMGGTYMMQTEAGEEFPIDVPTFSLDSPYAQRTIN